MKVYIVFDCWDEYDEYEDRLMPNDNLVDVFSSYEGAIECIKELIAKHNVETFDDRDLEKDGEIYGQYPDDGAIHNYYISERLVK